MVVALRVRGEGLFPDHWMYLHDPQVKVGRIQNLNNWGPDMVPRRGVTCLSLEFFCSAGDDFWSLSDEAIAEQARRETVQLGVAEAGAIFDHCVVRVEKAYPTYDLHYREHVAKIRRALAAIENLQVIGRNGMHRYNNQDHSMLTGILAARNLAGRAYNVWGVNADAEYLEDKAE